MRRSDSKSTRPVATDMDLNSASPDEIKAGIARTRAHMDERLTDLGRKIRPGAKLRIRMRRAKIPLAAGAAALCAFLAYRAARAAVKSKSERHGPKAGINRLKIKSAGVFDYVRALRLLATTIRKGKPGIFIVDPGMK